MHTGTETTPRSTSTRILMGGWWFVCLVLAATFTANLTAIFAIEDSKSDIPDTINELISKIPPNIPFGVFNNTSTAEYFKLSPIPQYREAFQYMKMENLLFDTEDEALTAVFYDNVAVIVDSPYAQFLTSRKEQYNPDCTLKSIGDGQFSPEGFALGLAKNSPFTNDFSLALLELRQIGEIENLRIEYFDHRRTCTSDIAITSASISMDTEQIELKRFGGLFILLGMAIVISLIFLLVEHTIKHRESLSTMIVKVFYTQHQKEKEEEESVTVPNSEEGFNTSTEL